MNQLRPIILSTLISLATIAAAVILSYLVINNTRGPNYSDVGVPMFTNHDIALGLGLAAYFSTVGFIYFLGKRWVDFEKFDVIYLIMNSIALLPAVWLLYFLVNF